MVATTTLVEAIADYAIFMLDARGYVSTVRHVVAITGCRARLFGTRLTGMLAAEEAGLASKAREADN